MPPKINFKFAFARCCLAVCLGCAMIPSAYGQADGTPTPGIVRTMTVTNRGVRLFRPGVQHNLHLPDIQVHDPWILAHVPTKTFYLYTSNNGRVTGVNRPGTIVYRSQDLLNWDGPLVVFTLPEGTVWSTNQGAWAPEVHEYQGKFYLLTTLHNPGKIIAAPPSVWRTNHLRGTVIARSDSPEGPFTLLNTNGPVP